MENKTIKNNIIKTYLFLFIFSELLIFNTEVSLAQSIGYLLLFISFLVSLVDLYINWKIDLSSEWSVWKTALMITSFTLLMLIVGKDKSYTSIYDENILIVFLINIWYIVRFFLWMRDPKKNH